MNEFILSSLNLANLWLYANLILYIAVFAVALFLNYNFNAIIVGLIYLVPLIPFGVDSENAIRFLLVSFHNTIFGIIELVIFTITVRLEDITFNKQFIKQLFGHTMPIAIALIGLSFVARATTTSLSMWEFTAISFTFIFGSILRVLAVYQIGAVAFKFDIAFRDKQRLKTDQLYHYIRHPSYAAMMIVIFAYALTTHNLVLGTLGVISGWFGFQYRIIYEDKVLEEQFGQEYKDYKVRTGTWFPKIF
jgi:protein-S-isoprenylcysteine O-methyltransferase Ste14